MFYTNDPPPLTHGQLCHQLHMTALCVTHSLEEKPASWPDRDTDILHTLTRHKLWVFCYVFTEVCFTVSVSESFEYLFVTVSTKILSKFFQH